MFIGIKDFITLQGNECLLSCFYNCLRYYDININESDIFFIGNGFETAYSKINSNGSCEIILNSCIHESIITFCKQFNVEIIHFENSCFKDADNLLKDSLIKKIPLIIKIDAESLKYSPVYRSAEDTYHYINILGSNNQSFLISDSFIPTVKPSLFSGWVPAREIYNGWREYGYECYEIVKADFNYLKEFLRSPNFSGMIRRKIKDGLGRYLLGKKEKKIFYGIAALEGFKTQIPFLFDIYKDDFCMKMIELNHKIRIWGIQISRIILREAILRLNLDDLVKKDIIKKLNILCDKWNSFCFFIVKTGIAGRKIDLELLKNRFENLIEFEYETFLKLYKVL